MAPFDGLSDFSGHRSPIAKRPRRHKGVLDDHVSVKAYERVQIVTLHGDGAWHFALVLLLY